MTVKKRVALVGMFMAALMLTMFGCTYTSTPTDGVVPADDAVALELADGQVSYSQGDMLVTLASNPTTGYGWTCAIEGEVVTSDIDEYLPTEELGEDKDGQAKAGAGGVHTFGFKAEGTGEATLTLTYARSWESNPDDKTIVIDVATTDGMFTHVEAKES